METHSDNSLIVRYQEGDEKALEKLIHKHQKELFSFIHYKLGNDEELANDFFQETFIKIIFQLKEKKYNEKGKFIVWAKRIAQNKIIDYYRCHSKYIHVYDACYNGEKCSIFDSMCDHEDNIQELEIAEKTYDDLAKILLFLPQNQQEIIDLRFFKSMGFREIAEKTNVSINTTLGRVRYALNNIRKMMRDKAE